MSSANFGELFDGVVPGRPVVRDAREQPMNFVGIEEAEAFTSECAAHPADQVRGKFHNVLPYYRDTPLR